ncbi:hypothetical protein [Pseudoalteromonas rubra]|nr:hypothetical protein [Pseudoalteromonas rubra]
MKISIFILFATFFTSLSYAYDGWSRGPIDKIRIQGSRILITQSGATNPGKCSNTDYLYLKQDEQTHNMNMFSALLMAYASGAQVQLALKGCTGGGTIGYPFISEVWVQ